MLSKRLAATCHKFPGEIVSCYFWFYGNNHFSCASNLWIYFTASLSSRVFLNLNAISFVNCLLESYYFIVLSISFTLSGFYCLASCVIIEKKMTKSFLTLTWNVMFFFLNPTFLDIPQGIFLHKDRYWVI